MDNTLAGLIQGCAEALDDDTPRGILADWLEDHDQPERAELIRVQCRLAKWVPDWQQRRALIDRQDALTEPDVVELLKESGAHLRDLDLALNPMRTATMARLAERLAGRRVVNSLGMEFVPIPAGSFLMGSPDDERGTLEDEHPQHPVTLTRPFWMGRFAVTQQQFHDVIITRPSSFRGAQRPVENVSWHDAMQFCHYLGQLKPEIEAGQTYRLATEAEWEHACRAGSFTAFHTGATHSMERMNCQQRFDNAEPDRVLLNHTAEVGSYPPNAFGLYEMHGNVWEWCADWYDRSAYQLPTRIDPTGPRRGSERVMRGGCWEALGRWCRSAKRIGDNPDNSDRLTGFRVIVELAEPR